MFEGIRNKIRLHRYRKSQPVKDSNCIRYDVKHKTFYVKSNSNDIIAVKKVIAHSMKNGRSRQIWPH